MLRPFNHSFASAVFSFFLLLSCFNVFANNELEVAAVAGDRDKRASDDSIEFFLRQTLDNLRGMMKTGFPMLGLPRMEPLAIDNTRVETKHGRNEVKADFSNLLIYGLSTFRIAELHVHLGRMKMDIVLTFRNLTINGFYNMNGKVASIFPVYGNGRFEAYATDVIISGDSRLVTLYGGSLAVQNLNLDMTFDKAHVHFHDLLGGGPLSGAANGIVNLFGKRIFERSKPKLMKKLEETLTKSLNNKLATFNGLGS